MSKSIESYAHKSAKSVVIGWLRSAAANPLSAPLIGDVACVMGLSWRVNRDGPHYGVWEEYPALSDGTGIDPVWDEAAWGNENFRHLPDDRPPTFDELTAIGHGPAAILDIAIQHKGMIAIGIEINHKHRCSQTKIDFLNRFEISELIQLPASWVLGQVGVPKSIPDEFWLLPEYRPSRQKRREAIKWIEEEALRSIAR